MPTLSRSILRENVYPGPFPGKHHPMDHPTELPALGGKHSNGTIPSRSTSLEPTPHGYAARVVSRLGHRRAWVSGAIVGVVGYVVMALVLLGMAFLVTHLLAPGPVGVWDNGVNRWFVTQRTSALDTAAAIGSALGGAPVVMGVALITAIALSIARRWRALGLLATGLLIEAAAFLTTATLIYRPRPPVPKLELPPPTSSFPSGHTAAAIVLYVSLAIIMGTLTRSRSLRVLAWFLAIFVPALVGASRMYRGMHHPTDVIGAVILGVGALLFALLAARTAGEMRARFSETGRGRSTTAQAEPDQRVAAVSR